ncbi:MAG TPA: hypothetical protein G4O15_05180 [Dehalococcoidia bacterium]|nr:hypothetical protein [Dehalococcoidia bacterium]
MAPLQKRALYSLAVGIVLAAAVIVVLVIHGDVPAFFDNLNSRMVLYAAVIGVPLIYLILVNISLRKPTQIDERDKSIIEQSRSIQWVIIVLSLAAWTIGLTEAYSDQGQVPIEYLNLIFMSILIISPLAQSLGIVAGYWSMNRDG